MSIPITFGKGVNKDLLPSELPPGVWSDMLNFRSRNGFDEKFEGSRPLTAPPAIITWLNDYETPAAVRWVIECSDTKAYAWTGVSAAARNEITRYTDGVAITSITRVGTTATVATDGAHGRTTGDVVSVYGALPAAYNATGAITVTGATAYTYVMASDPGASASPVGAYTYNVTQNFGSGRASGGSLNGILIVNKPLNGTYYWGGDTTVPLRKFPASNICDIARPFLYYVLQLAPTENGVKDPYKLIWSNAAEQGTIPSSFTPSATNDSGFDLVDAEGGPLVDCLPMGDTNIIYQRSGRSAMQHVEGNDVFRITRLPGKDGLLAPNCVVDTPKGHVFLTQNADVMIHQGGQAVSIAEGRIRKWIASNLEYRDSGRYFLCTNPAKAEVWVGVGGAYPTGYPLSFAVWNWEGDTWGIFGFSQYITFAKSGTWPTGFWTSGGINTALLMEVTDDIATPVTPYLELVHGGAGLFMGADVTGTLERTGMDFGDRDTFKTVQRSRWNFDATTGVATTATIYHGTSKTADADPTWTAGATYTVGTTDYLDGRSTSGRFGGVKLSTTAAALSARSADLDITKQGKR